MTVATETELLRMINREVSLDETSVIERDTDLLMSGLVDSLGVVQIVDWMESRFELEIDPTDVVIEHFGTVDLMLRYLEGRGVISPEPP